MQQTNELSDMLNQHFKWNLAKMDCFCGMLIERTGATAVDSVYNHVAGSGA